MATTRQIKKKYRELIYELERTPVEPVIKQLILEITKRLDKITERMPAEDLDGNRFIEAKQSIIIDAVKFVKTFEWPVPLNKFSSRFSRSANKFFGSTSRFYAALTTGPDAKLIIVTATDGKSRVYDLERWNAFTELQQVEYKLSREDRAKYARNRELRLQAEARERAEAESRKRAADCGLPFDPENTESQEAWEADRMVELQAAGMTRDQAFNQSIEESVTLLDNWRAAQKAAGVPK